MEYIVPLYKLARTVIEEGREQAVPFVLSIKGVYSAEPPIAYIFAIDTSYSMDGEKIFWAKQAAIKFLDITRDIDFIEIISFSGKTRRVLDITKASNRETIEKAIASLRLGSGTNIYDTLKMLNSEAQRILDKGLVGTVRIVFITDGEPTRGNRKPSKILDMGRQLRKTGAPVLVLGVGTEYNEKLLMRLANVANGLFEHISNPKSLEKIISSYAKKTREISARNVNVVFRINPPFRINIYNRPYDVFSEGIRIELGDIHYNEIIDVVGEINIPPLKRGHVNIGEIHVSYINPETNEQEIATPIPITIDVKPEITTGQYVNEEVVEEATIITTAKEIEQALEKGNRIDLSSKLDTLIQKTIKIGSRSLTAKTLNIKERIEKEGITPETSKDIASIISRIISGKIKEENRGGKNE